MPCQLLFGGCLAEEEMDKDDYLRPRRLRRSSAARNTLSSGEHSLAGTEIASITPFSGKGFPPVKGTSAGGNHPKKLSPPTTAASPKYSSPQCNLLRPSFALRSLIKLLTDALQFIGKSYPISLKKN